jgi:hypothetical protein
MQYFVDDACIGQEVLAKSFARAVLMHFPRETLHKWRRTR